MRTRSPVISMALVSALVLTLAVTAFAADNPFVGTWKMNPAKSQFSYPQPKSYTVRIEGRGDGIQFESDLVNADGTTRRLSFTAKYDGKDYPAISQSADAISLTRPDSNTQDYVGKKSGKEVWRGRSTVSKDGKVWIDSGGGKDANGQAYTYSYYMERQ
jgi:hypothetical protein